MKNLKLIAVGLAALAISTTGHSAGNLQNVEIFCSKLLQVNPTLSEKEYVAYFDPEFISKIPYSHIIESFSQFQPELGNCKSFVTEPQATSGQYILTLKTQTGFDVTFSLFVNQSTGLFNGLRFNGSNDVSVKIASWSDVAQAANYLDHSSTGTIGATLKTADGKTRLTLKENHVFAIGSTFKLYVLGALHTSILKGQHRWDENLAIHDEWKSLPSGIMQDFPVGKEFSLFEFATKMISISDNTATDHLLNLLGKDAVEAMLEPMGNSHGALNIPFMSTLEMFKLKWAIAPEDMTAYIASDIATKRKVLANLGKISRDTVGKNGVSMETPTDIDTLEWFGSTDDTCNAILWLANQNSSEIRQVLSKNIQVVPMGDHWSFVGFKGGYEPGVLSMTYLLESKNGNRGCLSMSWNNTSTQVRQFHFYDVVGKTLALAESQIP